MSSGEAGYVLVHLSRAICVAPNPRAAFTASSISSTVAIPVEMIRGLPVLASFFSGMNDFDCLIEILIMVGGEFGNDVGRVLSANLSTANLNSIHGLFLVHLPNRPHQFKALRGGTSDYAAPASGNRAQCLFRPRVRKVTGLRVVAGQSGNFGIKSFRDFNEHVRPEHGLDFLKCPFGGGRHLES